MATGIQRLFRHILNFISVCLYVSIVKFSLVLQRVLEIVEFYFLNPYYVPPILEKVCDTLSAMARLIGVSIPMPRCVDRYSRFEQFSELPTEMQNMVFEAIARTEKPRMQFLAFGAKPIHYDLSNTNERNDDDYVLELKANWWGEQDDVWLRLDNMPPNHEYQVVERMARLSPGWLRHSWFREQERFEIVEVEQVNGITYAASQRAVRVLPMRCPYVDDSQIAARRYPGRCRGRQDCWTTGFVHCCKRKRFSHKRDIIAPIWHTRRKDQDAMYDPDQRIPPCFTNRMPAIADAERIAVICGRADSEMWTELEDQLMDYGWPGNVPKLRELFVVCLGDIRCINGGVLPAPFLESGGLKLTELDPTQHRFTTRRFRHQNHVFELVKNIQGLFDKHCDLMLAEEGSMPWETYKPSLRENFRRNVQIKVVHMGLQDVSPWRRWSSTISAWAINKVLDDVMLQDIPY